MGTAEFAEAKRIQAALKEIGIPMTLAGNPETCTTRNCKPGLEMFVPESHIPAVVEFLKRDKARDLGDLEIDPELLAEVFDPEKDTARCPACGDTFSTKLTECPGCGLGGFGIDASALSVDPEEPSE